MIIFRRRMLETAVMICIVNIDGKDHIIFEKRAKNIRQAGEISFPGGKKDKKDRNFLQTAIRETIEELGIKKENLLNVKKVGTFFSELGVIIECYISKLKVEKISDIMYNKDEVEKLLLVPIEFFIKNEPVIEEIEMISSVKFDPKKYNFPEKYNTKWFMPNRYIYIYMYENEAIWGMTGEIIYEFIQTLKEKGKVANYEYK